jgi:hypothetical protein
VPALQTQSPEIKFQYHQKKEKILLGFRAAGVTQVTEHLTSKPKAQNSSPSGTKTNKNVMLTSIFI